MSKKILAGLLLPAVYAASWNSTDLRALLTGPNTNWSSTTLISFPGDEEFTNATDRWTITDAPSFSAAITPATAEDVAAAVKLAVANDVPILATGKHHGYTTTLDELQDGLSIDLAQLNSYSVDRDSGRVTIGGSVAISEFQDDLFEAGWMLQEGSVACPGFVGVTIGAGVGRYMGTFGLVLDALVGAQVVTASGDIVQVSETQNTDLFWAIRGAGANFGILTEATYQAHNISDYNNGYVYNADIYFSANQSAKYFQYLESISEKLPGNVGGIHLISYDNTTNSAELMANWVYLGPEAEARSWLDPILKLEHSSADFEYVAWNKLIATAAGGAGAANSSLCDNGWYRNFYTVNLRNLSGSTLQDTVETMGSFYRAHPDATESYVNLEVFPNQATAAIPDDSTAYPWRDAKAYIQVGIQFADPATMNNATVATGDKVARGLRESWVESSGYDNITIYINYAHGDEELEQKYGADKLPRLASLKKTWDPTNVFAFNNALPTEWNGTTSSTKRRV